MSLVRIFRPKCCAQGNVVLAVELLHAVDSALDLVMGFKRIFLAIHTNGDWNAKANVELGPEGTDVILDIRFTYDFFYGHIPAAGLLWEGHGRLRNGRCCFRDWTRSGGHRCKDCLVKKGADALVFWNNGHNGILNLLHSNALVIVFPFVLIIETHQSLFHQPRLRGFGVVSLPDGKIHTPLMLESGPFNGHENSHKRIVIPLVFKGLPITEQGFSGPCKLCNHRPKVAQLQVPACRGSGLQLLWEHGGRGCGHIYILFLGI